MTPEPGPYSPRPAVEPGAVARLARAVAAAFDLKKVLLAALGLAALRLGWAALDLLFEGTRGAVPWTARDPAAAGGLRRIAANLGPNLDALAALAAAVAEPLLTLVAPFVALFAVGHGVGSFVHAALAAAWGVVVWGPIGGAIARIAAVQLGRADRVGVTSAVKFAAGRPLALIGPPLAPMIGVGFFAALAALVGLIYWVPGSAAAIVAGVVAFLPLLAGLVMALLLAGLWAGWPLMIATVAVEKEDGFDALSRSYSYASQRPLRYAGLVVLAWALGVVGLAGALALTALVVQAALWGLAFGAPDAKLLALFEGNAQVAGPTAAAVHRFWIWLVQDLFVAGWIYGYFFTAAVAIYLLLRRDVDGAPWDDIAGYRPEDRAAAPAEG